MDMPAEVLATMKAQLVDPARGWRVVSVSQDKHTEASVGDVGGVPTPMTSVTRTATLTVQSAVMRKAIIIMLSGDGEDGSWSRGNAYFDSNTFAFGDAQLLTWCTAAIAALQPVAIANVMASFFGPIPVDA
jgi:hypothetical protein